MNYEEKLLIQLVEGYRKSKKDTGENLTNRRTKVKPEKIYSKYRANDGDFEKIALLNQTVEKLEEKGYVTTERETFGTELNNIFLVDQRLEEIEQYLEIQYQYEPKDNKLQKLKRLVEQYQHASKICQEECRELKEKLDKRQIPGNLDELEQVLKAVAFIENNEKDLYIREVSTEVYGDSKFFENSTMDAVCTMFKRYEEDSTDAAGLKDEILKKYHIFKEPQKLSIKGRVVLKVKGIEVDLTGFSEGIEFTASELEGITEVKLLTSNFMTVENRTSYLRYKRDDTVIFYLGGYANRDQREFLKRVYQDNPDAVYLHFGDIDAGGLWIHHHLCEITGIRFQMFCMSEKELKAPRYKKYLHTLSENDRVRLQELKEKPEYRDIVEYMLEKSVKLEQEPVSLQLMEGK